MSEDRGVDPVTAPGADQPIHTRDPRDVAPGSPGTETPAREPSGLPDDRFDGTDSGHGGVDTAYPPGPAAGPATGTDYDTDGPDEPAGTPQR